MRKLKAFLNLTRMNHGIFLAIAVVIGQLIANSIPLGITLVLSLVTPIFISSSAFALNDYMDYEADKANEREDRPLVSGHISKKTALTSSLLMMPIGIASSYFINIDAFLIALIFSLVSFEYAFRLKKVPLIGNLSIAASMSIPFLYGVLTVSESVPVSIWILTSMVFLAGTGREIVKSIQDMKGDREQGRRTLPIEIGREKSSYLALFLIALAVSISPIPYLELPLYSGELIYLFTVALCDFTFAFSGRELLKGRYREFRKRSFQAMGLGLVAFISPILVNTL